MSSQLWLPAEDYVTQNLGIDVVDNLQASFHTKEHW